MGKRDCSLPELLRTRNLLSLACHPSPTWQKISLHCWRFWLEGTCAIVPRFQNAIIPLSKVYYIMVLTSLTDEDVLLKTAFILSQGYGWRHRLLSEVIIKARRRAVLKHFNATLEDTGVVSKFIPSLKVARNSALRCDLLFFQIAALDELLARVAH